MPWCSLHRPGPPSLLQPLTWCSPKLKLTQNFSGFLLVWFARIVFLLSRRSIRSDRGQLRHHAGGRLAPAQLLASTSPLSSRLLIDKECQSIAKCWGTLSKSRHNCRGRVMARSRCKLSRHRVCRKAEGWLWMAAHQSDRQLHMHKPWPCSGRRWPTRLVHLYCNLSFQGAGAQSVLMDWSPKGVVDKLRLGVDAPNLVDWLVERFIADDSPRPDYFATDPVQLSTADVIASKEAHVPGSQPPGEGLLSMLGPTYAPWGTEENVTVVDAGTEINTTVDNLHIVPSTTRAINYDYAFAFPRTVLSAGESTSTTDIVERFVAYPHQVRKGVFVWDTDDDLLNHSPPTLRPEVPAARRCAECSTPLATSFSLFSSSRRTHCRYCGRFFCSSCCSKAMPLPSYIVNQGDFAVHTICDTCDVHLQRHLYMPLIDFDCLSSAARRTIGLDRIARTLSCRQHILHHLHTHVLRGCPSRHSLISFISNHFLHYVTEFPDRHQSPVSQSQALKESGCRVSLNDLLETQARAPLELMEAYHKLLSNHVSTCPFAAVGQCSNQQLNAVPVDEGVASSPLTAPAVGTLWDSQSCVPNYFAGD
eukprot:m.333037 g.333037  ORF g.333037 m.333037 type:complete len:590 (-) comp19779_c3_seq18:251-2020(-)